MGLAGPGIVNPEVDGPGRHPCVNGPCWDRPSNIADKWALLGQAKNSTD